MRIFTKSGFVNLFSCVALLAFLLSPCNCFAKESDSAQHTKKNAHDCCDDENGGSEKHKQGCDNCDGCTLSSGCESEVLATSAAQNTSSLEADTQATPLLSAWLPKLLENNDNTVSYNGPPGIRVTSSASLSTLLQRWLI